MSSPDVLTACLKAWCGVPSLMGEGVERKSTSQQQELPSASSRKPRPDDLCCRRSRGAAALSCLLLAAPLCLARSAAVGSPLTHAVTCCQSVTAADLVSMRGASLAKMLLLGFTTLHTFPHCSRHSREALLGGDNRFQVEERMDVIWLGGDTRNCVRHKIESRNCWSDRKSRSLQHFRPAKCTPKSVYICNTRFSRHT